MTPYRFLFPLLLLAAPLGAQDARLRNRLAPEAFRGVQLLVDSARAEGLPAEPLVQKALEGQSKQAASDRIVGAVRLLLGSLRESQLALGRQAEPDEVIAGANALRAGASPALVGALRRQRGGAVTIPLSVLTDLVARGIAPAAAGQAVTAMVGQGISDRDFLILRTQVEEDIRGGVVPGTALERRLSGLPAAAPPRRP
jgi:hypothetical protein